MSLPWVFRPMAMLLVVLHFLGINSAINIESVRRYFDPEVIHKGAGNAGRSLTYRDTGIFQPVRRPTLLAAKGNQSRYSSDALIPWGPELDSLARSICITQFWYKSCSPTPQQWSTLNNGGPIDFKPWSGHLTIRVTRRQNAATIENEQIYNLQLDCLYKLFNRTAYTREHVLPAKSVVCNTEILSFLSIVITSKDAGEGKIGVPAVVDTLVSIQELTHHLSIQEMDFEFFNLTGAGGDKEPIATG